MTFPNETGNLIVGVEYGGELHREFELRPQLLRDSLEVLESPDGAKAQQVDAYYVLCLLIKQIVRIGTIPREAITPDFVMGMYSLDTSELYEARERIEQRLRSFRLPDGRTPEKNAGNDEAGVQS